MGDTADRQVAQAYTLSITSIDRKRRPRLGLPQVARVIRRTRSWKKVEKVKKLKEELGGEMGLGTLQYVQYLKIPLLRPPRF